VRHPVLGEVVGATIIKGADLTASEEQDQNIACTVADVRKIYLANSTHNASILVAMALVISAVVFRHTGYVSTAVTAAAIVTIFGQLPYMIGQAAMYDALLVSYEGLQRAQVSEKLHRYAPLFPKLDFLKALSATGTAGGLLVLLIREFGKDILK
jgi:hypothetical protein